MKQHYRRGLVVVASITWAAVFCGALLAQDEWIAFCMGNVVIETNKYCVPKNVTKSEETGQLAVEWWTCGYKLGCNDLPEGVTHKCNDPEGTCSFWEAKMHVLFGDCQTGPGPYEAGLQYCKHCVDPADKTTPKTWYCMSTRESLKRVMGECKDECKNPSEFWWYAMSGYCYAGKVEPVPKE
jgi:hypothetical protein